MYVDAHPLAWAMDEESGKDGPLTLKWSYLHRPEALQFDSPGSYAGPGLETEHNITREWCWSVASVVGALWPAVLAALAAPLVVLLALPVFALVWTSSSTSVWAGFSHPAFLPALWLSARTTIASLALVIGMGTPLAWWLARGPARWTLVVARLVDALALFAVSVARARVAASEQAHLLADELRHLAD